MAKVLLVDDHPDTREILAHLLGTHGHRVETSSSGEEALSKIAQDSPDAVICDDRLPGMSGLEVLQFVRQELGLNDIQVVICSAADNSREAALEMGANEFWLKGSSALFDIVERFAERLKSLPARA